MADAGRSGETEAARLEAALARIARARLSAQPPPPDSPRTPPTLPTAEIKSRLDALITDLRAVLGRDSSD